MKRKLTRQRNFVPDGDRDFAEMARAFAENLRDDADT